MDEEKEFEDLNYVIGNLEVKLSRLIDQYNQVVSDFNHEQESVNENLHNEFNESKNKIVEYYSDQITELVKKANECIELANTTKSFLDNQYKSYDELLEKIVKL